MLAFNILPKKRTFSSFVYRLFIYRNLVTIVWLSIKLGNRETANIAVS